MTPQELSRVMRERKWSGVALARALGVAPAQVAKWRSGTRPVPEHQAAKISELTDGNAVLKSNDEAPWRPPPTFGPARTKQQKQQDKAARQTKAARFVDPAAIDARRPTPQQPVPTLNRSLLALSRVLEPTLHTLDMQRGQSGEFGLAPAATANLPAVISQPSVVNLPTTPGQMMCAVPHCGNSAAYGRRLCSGHAAMISVHPMVPALAAELGSGSRSLLDRGLLQYAIPTPAAAKTPELVIKPRPAGRDHFGVRRSG